MGSDQCSGAGTRAYVFFQYSVKASTAAAGARLVKIESKIFSRERKVSKDSGRACTRTKIC